MKTSTALDGFYSGLLRVDRAEKHLDELRELIERVERENQYSVIPHPDHYAPDKPIFVSRGPIRVPPIGAVLIGEVCYNLRCALDYLIVSLTELDCGTKPERTQFPIEDSGDKFRSWKKKIVAKGMNTKHAALFHRLQPYDGCDWIGFLAQFNNWDKHNDFVRIDARAIVDTDPPQGSGHTFVINAKHPVTKERMQVNTTVTIQILFDNGLPIVETLEKIKAGVTQTFADFKPEFEREKRGAQGPPASRRPVKRRLPDV
jgi:hypothetical protein